MVAPSSLCDLPLELIDHICSFVDRPKDLLSFSLTSKRVCGIVIPNHIECRHIRCDVRRVALWKKLADLPSIASQFVSLEIIGRFESTALTTPIVPNHHPLLVIPDSESGIMSHWQNEDREECWFDCIHALSAAVRVMPGLRTFRWKDKEEASSMNDVFQALQNCCRLDDVQIVITPDFDDEDELYICHSPLWELSNLRIFSFNCYDITGTMDSDYIDEYTKNMLKMLIQCCLGLEDLQLNLGGFEVTVSELFRHGRWPMLRRLTLTFDIVIPNDTINTFLNAHPTLEYLSIPPLTGVKSVRWMENVHRLRGLSCADPWDIRPAILRHTFRYLNYLALVNYSSTIDDFCLQPLAEIPTLRRLVLRGCRSPAGLMAEVARAVPQLQRLHFNHYNGCERPMVAKIVNDEDGAFVLANFRHLTHLSRFICLDQLPDGSVSNEAAVTDRIVERCATACPVLKYINLPAERIDRKRNWITIERDEEGNYLRWSATDDNEKQEVEVETWGGFFLGAEEGYMSPYLH